MNHSRATFRKLWSKSYVFEKKAKLMPKGQLPSVQLQNFTNFVFLYVYYALEFSSSIEMWNKINSFTNLIAYAPFVVAMFMGPFLKVCLGPLTYNIHHGQAIPESVCNGSVNTRAALTNWKASWYLRKILLPIRLAGKWFQNICGRIGRQLTSGEDCSTLRPQQQLYIRSLVHFVLLRIYGIWFNRVTTAQSVFETISPLQQISFMKQKSSAPCF